MMRSSNFSQLEFDLYISTDHNKFEPRNIIVIWVKISNPFNPENDYQFVS